MSIFSMFSPKWFARGSFQPEFSEQNDDVIMSCTSVMACAGIVALGNSVWYKDGNVVGSEKWLGTVDAYDLPFRVNNVEAARFLKTGLHLQVSGNIYPATNLGSVLGSITKRFDTSYIKEIYLGTIAGQARFGIVAGAFTMDSVTTSIRIAAFTSMTLAAPNGFDFQGNGQFSSGNLGIGGIISYPSALFEVKSTTKGSILSRMTTTQRLAITPDEGLIVYDLTLHMYYFYNGTVWVAF